MYNLLIGFSEHTALGSRVFEHTDPEIVEYAKPGGVVDASRLLNLPTLVMPEVGDSSSPPIARVGRVTDVHRRGNDYRFTFRPNSAYPGLSTDRIATLASELGISDWELHRTHWAVKDIDLYRVLIEANGPPTLSPQVFKFPIDLPREPDLVAVMMPFGAEFTPVYAAIRESVEQLGLRCHRADDIWEKDHIMDDVISLIWRAQVVVADLTSKNPNVFYETGITHALGRSVLPIAQSIEDVPFDLRSIRTLTYLANQEGYDDLQKRLYARLGTLTSRP